MTHLPKSADPLRSTASSVLSPANSAPDLADCGPTVRRYKGLSVGAACAVAIASFGLFAGQQLLAPLTHYSTDFPYLVEASENIALGNGYRCYSKFWPPPEDISSPRLRPMLGWPPLPAYQWAWSGRILGRLDYGILACFVVWGLVSWGLWAGIAAEAYGGSKILLFLLIAAPVTLTHAWANWHGTEVAALPFAVIWFYLAWLLATTAPDTRRFRTLVILASLVAGAAFWVRYSLIFLPVANVLWLAWLQYRSRKPDVLASSLAILSSALPIVLLLILNRLNAETGGAATYLDRLTAPGVDFTRALDPLYVVNLVFGPSGLRFLMENVTHRLRIGTGAEWVAAAHWTLGLAGIVLAVLITRACRGEASLRETDASGEAFPARRRFVALTLVFTLATFGTLLGLCVVRGAGGPRLERYYFYAYPFLLVLLCEFWESARGRYAIIARGFVAVSLVCLSLMFVRGHFYTARNLRDYGIRAGNIVAEEVELAQEVLKRTAAQDAYPVIVFSMENQFRARLGHPMFPSPLPGFVCSEPTHVFVFGSPDADYSPSNPRLSAARVPGGYPYLQSAVQLERIYHQPGMYRSVPLELWHGIAQPEEVQKAHEIWGNAHDMAGDGKEL